ncbi:MAG: hypothetical protein V3S55_08345 [Nitrospiraceae bacterium]
MPEHKGRYAANPQHAEHMSEAQPDSPESMAGMKSRFPRIHNSGKATKDDGELTFSYLDSYSKADVQTLPELGPEQIVEKVQERLDAFHKDQPGAREGDKLRAERKHVAAHDESILREAWELMDDHQKMELEMMLDRSSHHGISDPAWLQENEAPQESIPFAGGENAS